MIDSGITKKTANKINIFEIENFCRSKSRNITNFVLVVLASLPAKQIIMPFQ
jgi:hypothetical protein